MSRRRGHILIALAGAFFLLTSWLGRPVDGVWNSPDETANAFWAERVAEGRPLAVNDILVGLGAGTIHPRSMGVAGDALVPGSFPGLILLFGALKLILKLPFFLMTPILTALAGMLFGALIARLFDRRVGFWAGALFFTHPAVLYYGARGLFHNELCLDLLIIAAAIFVLRPFRGFGRSEVIDDALGGFVFAWAIMTRASEAIWAITAFLAFLSFVKEDRWKRVGWALAGAALPTFIFLFLNASLYGSPFRTAYVVPAVGQVVTTPAPSSPPAASIASFLPFGFHPSSIMTHLWSYGLALFWWQSLLAAAGFVWWARGWRGASGAQKTYAVVALAASGWLAVFYGSWQVMDRFDPNVVTIGTSYVRYFLPAYVVALPFAALALTRASDAMRKPWIATAAVVLGAYLAAWLTIYAGDESLRAVRLTLEGNARKKTVLLRTLPSEAVVMTERFDKLLVSDRLRIIPATDAAAFSAAAMAVAYSLPVYWYGLDPSAEELRRLSDAAARAGLTFGAPSSPIMGESLYPLMRL